MLCGAYALGFQRVQLAFEKRELARQLHYARHSAPLKSFSKQYEFGMVFFAVMGAVSLMLFGANSGSEAWMAPCSACRSFYSRAAVPCPARRWSAGSESSMIVLAAGSSDRNYSTHIDGLNNFEICII